MNGATHVAQCCLCPFMTSMRLTAIHSQGPAKFRSGRCKTETRLLDCWPSDPDPYSSLFIIIIRQLCSYPQSGIAGLSSTRQHFHEVSHQRVTS